METGGDCTSRTRDTMQSYSSGRTLPRHCSVTCHEPDEVQRSPSLAVRSRVESAASSSIVAAAIGIPIKRRMKALWKNQREQSEPNFVPVSSRVGSLRFAARLKGRDTCAYVPETQILR